MKKLVLLIPGNPSVPGVYQPFTQHFQQQIDCDEIIVLPHLGQANSEQKRFKKVSLHHVIEDHRQNIHKLIKQYNPREVILMGHSLGSAIVVQLYDEFKDRVDHFNFLMPFLGPTQKNRIWIEAFRNSFSNLYLKTLSKGLLVNKKVSQAFMHRMVGEENQWVARELNRPHYIHHFYSLLSTYKDTFSELKIRDKISQVDPKRSFFLFAKEDFWAPAEFVKNLPQNAKYLIEENVAHDFCLNEDHFKLVSNHLALQYRKN